MTALLRSHGIPLVVILFPQCTKSQVRVLRNGADYPCADYGNRNALSDLTAAVQAERERAGAPLSPTATATAYFRAMGTSRVKVMPSLPAHWSIG